ncbi:lysozyme [Acinetobacter sp. ANC 4169]|uniref:glycoside hydrolase family 25 protein n=1 Tax=Acinetobacter sp. ANC 4169 TaxID=1977879 RepID=UPI000A3533C3|nr:GH25 family lysozyme [Acinetobacter sp. ANC 4169]OTG72810.1 lysozyme [Acinetobacter sp. ANC 4169]
MPKKRFAKSNHHKLYASCIGLMLSCVAIVLYVFVLHHNPASAQEYPVKGFDVSHHQGDIQWKQISPKSYQFVYLKATEGGDFKDRKFQDYWLQAREHGLLVGAYHFYRLCRDGEIQAQNFIETVPNKADALPPVIDLEYDSNCINTYTKEQLLKEIQVMHDRLYRHYGKQPIFYISKSFYNIILAGEFVKTPLWVREYKGKPDLKGNPKWLFWQHTNQGTIKGITKAVDLNVFNGDEEDWTRFLEDNGLYPIKKVENLPKK